MAKPRVAKTDIKVFKILKKQGNKYVTPCRNYPVNLDETVIGSDTNVKVVNEDEKYKLEIDGDFIHALTSYKDAVDYNGNNNEYRIFDAIIPTGTEYFVSDDLTQVAAHKLHITSHLSEGNTQESFYEEIVNDYFANTQFDENVMPGDVVYRDLTMKHLNEVVSFDNVIGVVSAIVDGKIYTTALKQEVKKWCADSVDAELTLSEQIAWDDSYEKIYNNHKGEQYTNEIAQKKNISDYPAFEYCINYNVGGRKWHLDSIGTLRHIIRYNMNAINTTIAFLRKNGVDADYIINSTLYWASAEGSSTYAWRYNTNGSYVYVWRTKWSSYYVRPSFAIDIA